MKLFVRKYIFDNAFSTVKFVVQQGREVVSFVFRV